MNIYAILGGSGTGKSTATYAILNQFPDLFCSLHLDDFQNKAMAPIENGIKNRDHPDGIDFNSLYTVIKKLKNGEPVDVLTWDPHLNPNHTKTGEKITITVNPKPNLIIEGFLALHDPRIRELIDQSFYLDLDEETRLSRRGKILSPTYQNILIPMHNQFVEPQKQHATHIIDVTNKNVVEVKDFILEKMQML